MKVYIAACGMGLGHASRCLKLAERLRSMGIDVVFSTYGEASKLVKSEGFKVLDAPQLAYLLNQEGGVDFKLTLARGAPELLTFMRQVAFEARQLTVERPSVVLSDSRLSTIVASRALEVPSILLLNQVKVVIPRRRPLGRVGREVKRGVERLSCELLSLGWSMARAVLIADFPPPYTISRANLELPARLKCKVKLVGPLIDVDRLAVKGVEDKEAAKEALGFDDRPLVLLLAGGLEGERASLLRLMLRALRGRRDVNVLASMSTPGREVYVKSGSMTVVGWLRDRAIALKAADVLVTHGGHTSIAEAIYAATPMLIVPTPGHTERLNNALTAERLGVAKVVGEGGVGEVCEVLDELLSDQGYSRRALSLAREVAKFRAVEEVCREVEMLAN